MNATTTTTPATAAIFARKAYSLEDACFTGKPEQIHVASRAVMTAAQYDEFTTEGGFFKSRLWLAGYGGTRTGKTAVVEVSAPGRKTIYVNPDGGDYARYVGIAW